MSLRQLKKELQKESKGDLINHVAALYKKYPMVKEYFSFYLNPNEEALLEEYQQKIYKEFFPTRGYEIKLLAARQIISAFKKLGVSEKKQVELELYFVQCGVDCMNQFGDMWEAFYTSMENTYQKALTKAEKAGMLGEVQPLAKNIFEEGQEMGWGFSDYIGEVYFQFYSD